MKYIPFSTDAMLTCMSKISLRKLT